MGTEFGAFLVEEDSLYQGPGLSINQSYCRGTIFVQDEKRIMFLSMSVFRFLTRFVKKFGVGIKFDVPFTRRS